MTDRTPTMREIRLLNMLADDCEAWAQEAQDWKRMRRWFEAQPDADRFDGKDLIAAIEGRLGAIRDRLAAVQALLSEERPA